MISKHPKLFIILLVALILAGGAAAGWSLYVEYYMPPYERMVRQEYSYLRSTNPDKLTDTQARIYKRLTDSYKSLSEAAVSVVLEDELALYRRYIRQVPIYPWNQPQDGVCGVPFIKLAKEHIHQDGRYDWTDHYLDGKHQPNSAEIRTLMDSWHRAEVELRLAEESDHFQESGAPTDFGCYSEFIILMKAALIADMLSPEFDMVSFGRTKLVIDIYRRAEFITSAWSPLMSSVWSSRLYLACKLLPEQQEAILELQLPVIPFVHIIDAEFWIYIHPMYDRESLLKFLPDYYYYGILDKSLIDWVESSNRTRLKYSADYLAKSNWLHLNGGDLRDPALCKRFVNELGSQPLLIASWLQQFEREAYSECLKIKSASECNIAPPTLPNLFSHGFEFDEYVIRWNTKHPSVGAAEMSGDEIFRIK